MADATGNRRNCIVIHPGRLPVRRHVASVAGDASSLNVIRRLARGTCSRSAVTGCTGFRCAAEGRGGMARLTGYRLVCVIQQKPGLCVIEGKSRGCATWLGLANSLPPYTQKEYGNRNQNQQQTTQKFHRSTSTINQPPKPKPRASRKESKKTSLNA